MGLFKSKEEKERIKQEKELKKEASIIFMGESLQPIGKIPAGKTVGITLLPNDEKLNIHYDGVDITLPYERIRGFRLEDETTLAKSGNTIGRAVVGGALFGKTGAVVGGMSAKGNTNTKWIGTLSYVDKEGNLQELAFIQWGLTGHYEGATKHYGASKFENKANEIVARYGEAITEL
jgi:hypothetical protein